jgi:Beta/Gamma crystallin
VIVASGEPCIALFEGSGFSGRSLELTKTMGGLDRSGLYAGANAAVVYGGVWRLCSRQYFRGECADFVPGRYENLGSLTGRVSSAELVAVTSNAPVSLAPPTAITGQVVLYELPNFGGQSVVIDRVAIPDLQRVGFNDRASSIVIQSGVWTFCTDLSFRGDCRTLGPGQYAWLPLDVDRKIASARRINNVYGLL